MLDPQFIHLRMHSEFSIVDGIVRILDAARAAREDTMPALAITDLSNLFGMVKFYKAARAEGLKPIVHPISCSRQQTSTSSPAERNCGSQPPIACKHDLR